MPSGLPAHSDGSNGDALTVTASEVLRMPKKFKPKTRKPRGVEKTVLDAIERMRRGGTAAEELVEGWLIKLAAHGEVPDGIKLDLQVTAPDGTQLATVMDVKRKFGMVLKEAAEARAETKALVAGAASYRKTELER